MGTRGRRPACPRCIVEPDVRVAKLSVENGRRIVGAEAILLEGASLCGVQPLPHRFYLSGTAVGTACAGGKLTPLPMAQRNLGDSGRMNKQAMMINGGPAV